MRILIVEDSVKINRLLALFANQDGHHVVQAFSAEEAIELMKDNPFDIMLTDLMLPQMQGEQLIEIARSYSDIYIIAISAKSNIEDRLEVLGQGADDYITKPFSVEEVMLKLKNLEKRIQNQKPLVQSYFKGELLIYPMKRVVENHHEIVNLTSHEFDILLYLSQHPNRVFTRDEILESCLEASDAFDRVIDVHIKNIRQKINKIHKLPEYIKTHYGTGYQFIGEIDDEF